jgi:hypothetical protein
MMRINSTIFNLIRTRDRFLTLSLFTPRKSLEHPIVFVIFTSVLFIWWWDIISYNARLYRPFQLVLFRFGLRLLAWITLMYCLRGSNHLLTLVIVWSCCGIAFSGSHQPLIYFFIAFENAFIIWSSIIRPQSTFLSNYKIDLCNNWSISTRVFPCWRRWLRL